MVSAGVPVREGFVKIIISPPPVPCLWCLNIVPNVPAVALPEIILKSTNSSASPTVECNSNAIPSEDLLTSTLLLGAVVPNPNLLSETSMVISVVFTPPSFPLNTMSLSCASALITKSEDTLLKLPNAVPPSFSIISVSSASKIISPPESNVISPELAIAPGTVRVVPLNVKLDSACIAFVPLPVNSAFDVNEFAPVPPLPTERVPASILFKFL